MGHVWATSQTDNMVRCTIILFVRWRELDYWGSDYSSRLLPPRQVVTHDGGPQQRRAGRVLRDFCRRRIRCLPLLRSRSL